jgi:hypothetical protein
MPSPHSSAEHAAFTAEKTQAEKLLFDLATELVRLPFGGRTRALHLRALELKRRVVQWAHVAPSDADRRATCDGIRELQREAAEWRELLR